MRYFLNMRHHGTLLLDPDGTEVASYDEILVHATDAAREILAERLRSGEVIDGDAFEIKDELGNLVATLPLRSFLRLD